MGGRLAARQAGLDARQIELDTQAAGLTALQGTLETRQAELDDRRAKLETQESELASQRRDFDARQSGLDRQKSELTERESQLAERQAELTAYDEELVARRQTLETLQTEIEAMRAAAGARDEAPASPPEEGTRPLRDGAPVDTAAIFRRLGLRVPQEEPEVEHAGRSDVESQTAARNERPASADGLPGRQQPSAGRPSSPLAGHGEADSSDEESIDDYMAKLLQRVRGTTGEPLEPQTDEPGPAEYAGPSPARPGWESGFGTPSATGDKPMAKPRRTAAPEASADLSVLREVANVAAHAAISRHGRRTILRLSTAKLIVALLALVAGGGLIWMWWFFRTSDLTFYAGLVGLLIALFWGVQYAVLTGKLIVGRSGHLEWKPRKPPESPDPPPPPASDAGGDAGQQPNSGAMPPGSGGTP